MARFTRIEVAQAMQRQGVIPVFYHPSAGVCREILRASHAAGLRVFEFTNRGDFAHEIFAELNRWAAAELPGMILGAGSVVDAPTAALYMQLGANFIVSPLLDDATARACNRRKVLWSPGCGTLSEIGRAEELGAEIVKIFPGSSVGGPEFVKAIKGPCPWSSIMPTGGVEPTAESLGAWFSAGVACVGMGSNLFPAALIKEQKWGEITALIKEVLAIAASVRK